MTNSTDFLNQAAAIVDPSSDPSLKSLACRVSPSTAKRVCDALRRGDSNVNKIAEQHGVDPSIVRELRAMLESSGR